MHYGSGAVTRCRDVLASEFEFCSDLNTTRFLKRIIQDENPDFIAFTGNLLINFTFVFFVKLQVLIYLVASPCRPCLLWNVCGFDIYIKLPKIKVA